MEDPLQEIDKIIYKLTTGSPRLQQQTLEKYFTPNASFTHPICSASGNRDQILAIFRWYKILSPKIEIQVNGITYEEARQRLYIDISQNFRIWPLIPLGYRADVNLVTVLQLTRDPTGRDRAAERAIEDNKSATPRYGFNAITAADTSPFTSDGAENPATVLPSTGEPVKYYIKAQNDLYQTNELSKFASLLGILPLAVGLWHLFATYCCVLGAFVFSPFTLAMQSYSDKQVDHRARARHDPSFGPSYDGDMTVEERAREKERDIWELEARYLGADGLKEGELGKMKMEMKTVRNRE